MIPISNGWLHSHILSSKGGENIEANLKPSQITAIERIALEEGKTFDQALEEIVSAGIVLIGRIKEENA